MSDDDPDVIATLPAKPWPRAVAWLAVAAHISVAAAVWQKPQSVYVTSDHHTGISLSLLLAQVNLLTLWLVVGSAPVIRRLAWTVCGWSGIAYILATAETLQNAATFVIAMQVAVTAAIVGVLRFSRRQVVWLPSEQVRGHESLYRDRQYSILELFAAALGVAIAAALLTRIDVTATFQPLRLADSIQTMLAVSLPAAAMTLASTLGLRGNTSLSKQKILAGLALLLGLALQTDPHWRWDGLLEIHAAHWFVVAATLWIFQMCGYRLVRTTTMQSADR